jgi:integrator complex subunit 2
MPGLAVALTLLVSKDYHGVAMDIKDKTADVIAFVCGLLLGNNLNVRNWFSQYVKLGQKVSYLFFCLFQKIVNNNDQ